MLASIVPSLSLHVVGLGGRFKIFIGAKNGILSRSANWDRSPIFFFEVQLALQFFHLL
jgi:hypothetical protein